ncbi:MAG: APC family permease [Armatimonadota bacterium]
MIALAIIGSAAWSISLPIGICIVALIAIVSISYRQTIHAYPHGGGSYTVAKENLGVPYGLVAAASLLTDYVLTVAVSVASGIQAIIAVFPNWGTYRVELCVIAVAIVALANLRGLRESGALFAPPTYVFISCLYVLVGVGLFKVWVLHDVNKIVPASYALPVLTPVSLFIILRAFSSGCSALTGIEAIANGVPAFKPPESRNAATTMTIMAIILGSLVLGITYLGHVYHALPGTFITEHNLHNLPNYKILKDQTLIAQLIDHIFGRGWFYTIAQFATMAILVLAANTAFQDFPRLSSILARDRFAPRQLTNVGDRLVFSNGITLLSLFAVLLLIRFHGETTRLIPLYAVGVFISFTLSQWGMAVRQHRLKHKNWQGTMALSLFGGIITCTVALVIGISKFVIGAWMAVAIIFILVMVFFKIHQHYIELGTQLRLHDEDLLEPVETKTTSIVLTAGIHRGIWPALKYARSLSHDCRALYIEIDPSETPLVRERWEKYGLGVPLVILESPYRSVVGPTVKYIEEAKKERPDYVITVVLPEFVPKKWWHKLLHNQSGIVLKIRLMLMKDIIVTNSRYYLTR